MVWYLHRDLVFTDGRLVCSNCGVEVDEYLKSPKPCIGEVTAIECVDLFRLFYSAPNNTAWIIISVPADEGSFFVRKAELDYETESELQNLAHEVILQQGGDFETSRYYFIDGELAEKVAQWLHAGKIRIPLL